MSDENTPVETQAVEATPTPENVTALPGAATEPVVQPTPEAEPAPQPFTIGQLPPEVAEALKNVTAHDVFTELQQEFKKFGTAMIVATHYLEHILLRDRVIAPPVPVAEGEAAEATAPVEATPTPVVEASPEAAPAVEVAPATETPVENPTESAPAA